MVFLTYILPKENFLFLYFLKCVNSGKPGKKMGGSFSPIFFSHTLLRRSNEKKCEAQFTRLNLTGIKKSPSGSLNRLFRNVPNKSERWVGSQTHHKIIIVFIYFVSVRWVFYPTLRITSS
ncbi:hypothetical protein BGS_0070 [Beggiatoa sp. SS]|nr:hypothetical protein BGS_0070 [Beggiatoa sp. SS]